MQIAENKQQNNPFANAVDGKRLIAYQEISEKPTLLGKRI